jgi:hypothetical protein
VAMVRVDRGAMVYTGEPLSRGLLVPPAVIIVSSMGGGKLCTEGPWTTGELMVAVGEPA